MNDVLDYIYIINFRKLKDQGFHFTSKYRYTVAKTADCYSVSREENPQYLDNFYGEDIEICAVVGENGAGKTSLMKAVYAGFAEKGLESGDKFFLIFRSGHVKYYNIDSENISCAFEYDYDNYDDGLERNCIFYSNVLDYESFSSPIIDDKNPNISTGAFLHNCINNDLKGKIWTDPVTDFFLQEFKNQIQLICYRFSPKIKGLTYPDYVNIMVDPIEHIYDDAEHKLGIKKEKLAEILRPFLNSDDTSSKTVLEQFQERIAPRLVYQLMLAFRTSSNSNFKEFDIKPESNDILQLFLKILMFLIRKNIKDTPWNTLTAFIDMLSEIASANCDENEVPICNMTEEYYDTDKSFDRAIIQKVIETIAFICCAIQKLMLAISEKSRQDRIADENINEFHIYLKNPRYNDKRRLDISLNDLVNADEIFYIFYRSVNYSWGLSSGEYARLALFSRIMNTFLEIHFFSENDIDHLLLIFDEADMLLHPEWQKNFVKQISEFCQELFKRFFIQIIITTHSPIMLSDIPRQNTLFLSKDKKTGQTVSTEIAETFASNIYSLFKNSFFIDNGMIGLMAEEKLKDLADMINKMEPGKAVPEIEQRISMIGDEYIRMEFRELYNSKLKDPQNISARITELEKELNELKKKLKEQSSLTESEE